MSRLLFPSDSELSQHGPHLLAGRVIYAADGRLVLADAFTAVSLQVSCKHHLNPGDLVRARIQRRESSLELLEVLDSYEAPEPNARGEFSRLQAQERGRVLRRRSTARRVIREYFEEQDFTEVETPTFVPCPGLDAHVNSLAPVVRGERVEHLITSPEFHMKRLLTAGMPRVYQLSRCFRAEEEGRNHEPEFTLLEWYRAFATWEELMEDTEEIVCRVFQLLNPTGVYPGGTLQRPFARLSVREAFRRFAGVHDAIQLAETDPSRYFELLVEQVEPGLARVGRPVFLTHYPLSQAALAQPCPEDETVAERFELYVGALELCNGFGELRDATEQRGRFERELERRRDNDEPVYPIDERFLAALHEGMPPASGNAMGLERLLMVASGVDEIRSTLAFADDER